MCISIHVASLDRTTVTRAINSPDLSLKAKGLLSLIAFQGEGWQVQTADLLALSKDNKAATREALKELIWFGVCSVEQTETGITYTFGDKKKNNPLTVFIDRCLPEKYKIFVPDMLKDWEAGFYNPSSIDLVWRKYMMRHRGSEPPPLQWLLQQQQEHGWPLVFCAFVITCRSAERPTQVYLSRVINSLRDAWNEAVQRSNVVRKAEHQTEMGHKAQQSSDHRSEPVRSVKEILAEAQLGSEAEKFLRYAFPDLDQLNPESHGSHNDETGAGNSANQGLDG